MSKRLAIFIFLIVGIPPLAFGLWTTADSIIGQVTQTRTQGEVVNVETYRGSGKQFLTNIPIVEFTSVDGRTIRFKAVTETATNLSVGDSVLVRYDPQDPNSAYIDEFWNNWLFPILGLSFGLFFTVSAWGVATGRIEMKNLT